MGKIIRGTILNPVAPKEISIFQDGYIRIDDEGKIESLGASLTKGKESSYEFFDFSGKLIVPGFIDAHTHLSQFGFAGIGNMPLLPWLKKYTFPEEKKYADPEFAYLRAIDFFTRALSLGTTCVAAYITSHIEATHVAFAAAEKTGIRAFLGLVLMDRHADTSLCKSVSSVKKGAHALVKTWHNKNEKLFLVSTPRFAISCTSDMLFFASDFAKEHELLLQTHISENKTEVAETLKLFPDCKDYLEVYERHNCLGKNTLLAHGIYLSASELNRIKDSNATIVHCPTSNRFLGSGVMPYRDYADKRINVALGTDIAAGYDLSMFHETKEALESSKTWNIVLQNKGNQPRETMQIFEALYLATLGGAMALGKEDTLGNFERGKWADFLVLDDAKATPFHKENTAHREPLERLSRIFYRPFSGTLQSTWIAGKCLFSYGAHF